MSKANQFAKNEDAVSPVIGVILMVAITVVLAAVVFVLVSNLSKNSNQSAPNISFNQDKSAQTLTVISADQAKWSDIKATVTCGAGTPTLKLNGATVTLTSGVADPVHATATVAAGDALLVGGCTASNTGTLQLTYKPANQLLGSWTFQF